MMKTLMNIILIVALLCGGAYLYHQYKQQKDTTNQVLAINQAIRNDIVVALQQAQTSQDSVDILKIRLAQLRKQAATINHPPIIIPPIDSPTIITLCDTIRYKNVIDTLQQSLVIADEIIQLDSITIANLTNTLANISVQTMRVDTLVLSNRQSIVSKIVLVGVGVLIGLSIK